MVKLSEIIPNRVRALRMEKGWSLQELATKANTTAPQIMKLERSHRKLDLDWLDRLAAAFGVDPLFLMGADTKTAGLTMVPVVGRIAAGNWQEAVEDPIGIIPVPDTMMKGPKTFALRPDGDSMNLIIPENGWVLVNPEDGDLRDGKIYAVMNGEGETTLKRYRAEPARLEPCSTNPAHVAMTLGREPFTVVGRVTGIHQEV